MTKEQADKLLDRLTRKARRAAAARDNFEQALEKLQENQKKWEEFCELTDVAPSSTGADWLC